MTTTLATPRHRRSVRPLWLRAALAYWRANARVWDALRGALAPLGEGGILALAAAVYLLWVYAMWTLS